MTAPAAPYHHQLGCHVRTNLAVVRTKLGHRRHRNTAGYAHLADHHSSRRQNAWGNTLAEAIITRRSQVRILPRNHRDRHSRDGSVGTARAKPSAPPRPGAPPAFPAPGRDRDRALRRPRIDDHDADVLEAPHVAPGPRKPRAASSRHPRPAFPDAGPSAISPRVAQLRFPDRREEQVFEILTGRTPPSVPYRANTGQSSPGPGPLPGAGSSVQHECDMTGRPGAPGVGPRRAPLLTE